jgi:hypothetical protein
MMATTLSTTSPMTMPTITAKGSTTIAPSPPPMMANKLTTTLSMLSTTPTTMPTITAKGTTTIAPSPSPPPMMATTLSIENRRDDDNGRLASLDRFHIGGGL